MRKYKRNGEMSCEEPLTKKAQNMYLFYAEVILWQIHKYEDIVL